MGRIRPMGRMSRIGPIPICPISEWREDQDVLGWYVLVLEGLLIVARQFIAGLIQKTVRVP